MNYLDDVVSMQKKGEPRGLTSVCSAHPMVLEAAMRHAKTHNIPLLIEATCNQVNQFGGYTGMIPLRFVDYVRTISEKVNFSSSNILLGGDHLGPLVWAGESATSAMVKAKSMVMDYALAGFRKIHIDCSMPCCDDGALSIELIAQRTAELVKVVEEVCTNELQNYDQLPRYVIGSEVPAAGGIKSGDSHLRITRPADAAETIELTRRAFTTLGLETAWERVIALVVQPGVEFGDEEIIPYDRAKAAGLTRFIETVPGVTYEAHSTDYQIRTDLRNMVEDHYGILKVGPALTFALREAVFGLENIEELLAESKPSKIRNSLDKAMLENPSYWQKHYNGTSQKLKTSRLYSFSDRIRYYWSTPSVVASYNQLLLNLGKKPMPLSLISQYLPTQYEKVREKVITNDPFAMIIGQVMDVLEDYYFACTFEGG